MGYEIIYDTEKIKHLRYLQEFTIYDNYKEVVSDKKVTIDELESYVVEDQSEKSNRNFIVFNPFKDGRKQLQYAYLPNMIMIDIDVKGDYAEQIKQRIKRDMGEDTYIDAFQKLYNCLKNDPLTLYIDTSHSNQGLKCLVRVLSDYYVINEGKYDPSADKHGIITKSLMKENYRQVYSYLNEKYGVSYTKGEKDNYLDNSADKVTQGIVSSWGKKLHINPDAAILYYNYTKPISSIQKPSISNKELKKKNDEFCNVFIPKLQQLNKEAFINDEAKERFDWFLKDLSARIDHYPNALPVLFSLKHLDVEYLKVFYNFFKKAYGGNSIKLESFDAFYTQILKLNEKFGIPLKDLFSFFNTDEHEATSDLFGNSYDEILYYFGYVSEHEQRLFELFDNKKSVVLNADAGGGKTSLLNKYAYKKIKGGVYDKVVIIIPKNSLLQQQYEILSNCYGDIPIHRNYGKYNYAGGRGIILSSTPKLNKIKGPDLILIDEIQNLIKFSSEILSNVGRLFPDTRRIMYSATPEAYLLHEDSYFYIRLNKLGKKKANLYKYISKQNIKILTTLINPNRRQIIFFNNKRESVKIFTKDNFGTNFTFINGDNLETPDSKRVIENQKLYKKHYVVTSVISDGINFDNSTWDDIIIIENGGLTADEIYQLSNRFRKVKSLYVYLISKPRPYVLNHKLKFKNFHNEKDFKAKISANLKLEEELNRDPLSNKNRSLLESNNFIKFNGEFFFNMESVKKDTYINEFVKPYQIYQDVMDYALNYYFSIIPIFRIEKEKISISKNTRDIELFKAYGDNIVDILVNDTFATHEKLLKNAELDIPFNLKDWDYMKKNESTFKVFTDRYLEIEELKGDKNKATLNNNLYSKYINGLKKRRLGNEKNIKRLDGFDRLYWSRQNTFIDIVKNNVSKKYINGDYQYATVQEVLDYFSSTKRDYDKFRNENGGFDFNLTLDSIGKYMNGIGRFLIKKRPRIYGERLNIYKLIA